MILIAKIEYYILQLEGAVNQLQQENRALREQKKK